MSKRIPAAITVYKHREWTIFPVAATQNGDRDLSGIRPDCRSWWFTMHRTAVPRRAVYYPTVKAAIRAINKDPVGHTVFPIN